MKGVTAIPDDSGQMQAESASRLTAIAPAIGDRLLTASDVAELLAVPERWVREHTRGGLIPHVRLGRYVRYRKDAVVRWLDEHERNGDAWRRHQPSPGGSHRRSVGGKLP
jgi:excisionase family DNA binding protein